jgi:hypothetical protein
MENKEIRQNLKHGYTFLSVIVLTVFAISLSIEIYLKGGFKLNIHLPIIENEPVRVITMKTDNSGILLEFQNITDGYKTKDSSITIVAKTDIGNKAWINSKEVTSNDAGNFELKIDLTVGNNDILIEAENSQGVKVNKKITIIREEEKKEEPKPTQVVNPVQQPTTVQPKPENTPKPEPTPEPQPNHTITALKLHCSITNTQPSIGQTVSLDCSVKDQNSNPINGATGNTKINWQSGGQTIAFSNSQNGSMSINYVVPSGNKGVITGTVQVSKDGLTVTSNFSITVQ